MGIAMSFVTELSKLVLELGGKEEDIHRLVIPEGQETLRKMAKIAIEDGRPAVAEKRIPKDGDSAYSIYHGLIWSGTLRYVPWNKEGWGGCWVIVPDHGGKSFCNTEGHWKYLSKMSVANLGVYAEPYFMEAAENDSTLQKFGRGQPHNKRVEFDEVEDRWYCRAQED